MAAPTPVVHSQQLRPLDFTTLPNRAQDKKFDSFLCLQTAGYNSPPIDSAVGDVALCSLAEILGRFGENYSLLL